MAEVSKEITARLQSWSRGDPEALEELLPLVVADLRRAAHHYLQQENREHTLQATALVNEVYLRLQGRRKVRWDSRQQFFAFAGQLIRRILVDHARARKTAKRGRDVKLVSLTDVERPAETPLDPDALLDLHAALERFAEIDPRASRVVELRYFTGLSIAETAEVLGASAATIKRDWETARRWLAVQLDGEDRRAAL